jgi:hypothetical protein
MTIPLYYFSCTVILHSMTGLYVSMYTSLWYVYLVFLTNYSSKITSNTFCLVEGLLSAPLWGFSLQQWVIFVCPITKLCLQQIIAFCLPHCKAFVSNNECFMSAPLQGFCEQQWVLFVFPIARLLWATMSVLCLPHCKAFVCNNECFMSALLQGFCVQQWVLFVFPIARLLCATMSAFCLHRWGAFYLPQQRFYVHPTSLNEGLLSAPLLVFCLPDCWAFLFAPIRSFWLFCKFNYFWWAGQVVTHFDYKFRGYKFNSLTSHLD